MSKPGKIIQIETAAPVRADSRRPYLFALDYVGEVWVWGWNDRKWIPLAELDR